MEVRGRIPGQPGLWVVACYNARIHKMACVDPDFTDTRCNWITPGLFDLQVNGIAGINYTSPGVTVEELARADRLLRDKGISRYCPTLITCGPDIARAALGTFRAAWERGLLSAAWGIHLEGPWISSEDGYRGVHRLEFVRDPDYAELELFQRHAGGRIRIVTLAPERAGAEEFIRRATGAGLAVGLGHTNADPDCIGRAVRAGARMSTHLFNGCARMVDRHRNVIYSQLSEDSLFACFIADGHHVPYPTLRIGLRAKGLEKCVLVSDITPPSGLPDGDYEMEGNQVELRNGGIWVKGSWLLSGAARTLDQDVELLARESEPGIEQVLLMATRNPAAAVGDPGWAELSPGREEPIVVFSWDGRRLTLREQAGIVPEAGPREAP